MNGFERLKNNRNDKEEPEIASPNRNLETARIITANKGWKEFVGRDREESFLKKLKEKFPEARIKGGYGDKGCDIETGSSEISEIQVKGNWQLARVFLIDSVNKFHKFIPLCIGEPDNDVNVMIDSIKNYGAFVGNDILKRELILKIVKRVRDSIVSNEGKRFEEIIKEFVWPKKKGVNKLTKEIETTANFSGMKKGRFERMNDILMDEIKDMNGEDKSLGFYMKIKPQLDEAMNREMILQALAAIKWQNRLSRLLLNPCLIIPYLVRIRRL